jgi:PAS domain S-box-containing protein
LSEAGYRIADRTRSFCSFIQFLLVSHQNFGSRPHAPFVSLALAVGYAVLAALWIFLSDWLVAWLYPDPIALASAQSVNRWLLVAVTAVVLYLVLRRPRALVDASKEREAEGPNTGTLPAQLLQTQVEHSDDATLVKGRAGRNPLFNSAATHATGRDAASVVGSNDQAFFPAVQAGLSRANDKCVMTQDRVRSSEQELDTAKDRRAFLATQGPRWDQGSLNELVDISRETGSMAEARHTLGERELRYRTLFEAHPQPLWVFDLETLRFLDVNDAAVERYGYSREEFLTMTLSDIRPPEHRPALVKGLAARQAGLPYGSSVSGPWVHRRKDGGLIEVEIWSNDIQINGRHARLVMPQDITARLRLQRERDTAFAALEKRERELARSEQRFRLASMGGDVWEWDITSGRADYPSRFWQRLGHEPPSDRDPATFLFDVMHPEDRPHWRAAILQHLTLRRPYELEFRAHDVTGAWRWFYTRGQAVWDASGRATYMAGTTFDVTDRHAAEDRLLRTQHELTELAQRLLVQERETTNRLAHALHDQLGQTLGSARLLLDMAIRRSGVTDLELQDRLRLVSAHVDASISDVRTLLVELRPPLLQEKGLAAALDNELRRSLVDGTDTQLQMQAGATARRARWPSDVTYAAFMIAREALSNALRHAQARNVECLLYGDGVELHLSVRDDGRGISATDRLGRPGHLGLVGMRERAIAIGARLDVHQIAEGGTEVSLHWKASPLRASHE